MLSLPQLALSADPIPVHSPDASVPTRSADLLAIIGGLTSTGKMPCQSYSLNARRCRVGSKLRKVAGSTCSKCYAYGGCYNFPVVIAAMERRYASLTDPRWVAAFIRVLSRKRKNVFRWHDSGDLQSLNHLRNIVQVAEGTPNITHWIPTREYGIVRAYLRTYGAFPANLIVRVSAAMMESAAPAEFAYTSEVSANATPRDGVKVCPAYTQGGECRDCRTCWDSTVRTVIYPLH